MQIIVSTFFLVGLLEEVLRGVLFEIFLFRFFLHSAPLDRDGQAVSDALSFRMTRRVGIAS